MLYKFRSCGHWPKLSYQLLHSRQASPFPSWWLRLCWKSSSVTRPVPGRTRGVKATLTFTAAALVLCGAGYVACTKHQPFRHSILAVVRCSRVAGAMLLLVPCIQSSSLLTSPQWPLLWGPSITSGHLRLYMHQSRRSHRRTRNVTPEVRGGYCRHFWQMEVGRF